MFQETYYNISSYLDYYNISSYLDYYNISSYLDYYNISSYLDVSNDKTSQMNSTSSFYNYIQIDYMTMY